MVDRSTGEVIKQIPPEDMLKIAAKFQEFIGLIFDEKV
ncbi:MAG: flagellar protein FlaG [Bacillota bacterium]